MLSSSTGRNSHSPDLSLDSHVFETPRQHWIYPLQDDFLQVFAHLDNFSFLWLEYRGCQLFEPSKSRTYLDFAAPALSKCPFKCFRTPFIPLPGMLHQRTEDGVNIVFQISPVQHYVHGIFHLGFRWRVPTVILPHQGGHRDTEMLTASEIGGLTFPCWRASLQGVSITHK